MKKINLANIRSGAEFARIVQHSKENCFLLIGTEANPVLSKIDAPEKTPKFKIGDRVRMDRAVLSFNGVKGSSTWTVAGMEKVDDQYLYIVRDGHHRYEFFGYELEKCKGG